MADKKVILYSASNSIYCSMAKDFFKKHKIKFEERRIDMDGKAMAELLKIVPEDGVPTIVIDGKVYKYFDEAELKIIFKVKG